MDKKQEKLTVVEQCARQMMTLDAAGHGVIVMRCNSDSEIRRIISQYAYKEKHRKSRYAANCTDGAAEYTPASSDRLKEATPLGMVIRIGDSFEWTKCGYSKNQSTVDHAAPDSLMTDLANRVNYPQSMRHSLLYIPDGKKVLGDARGSTEIQHQYLVLLEELARKKKEGKSNALVVVGCTDGVIHEDLKRFAYIVDVPYPDAEELTLHIKNACKQCDAGFRGMPKAVLNGLAEEMRGFREDDVSNVITMAYAVAEDPLAHNAKALFAAAKDVKKQLIAGVTGLSWLDTDNSEIGGLERLTEWLGLKKWSLNYPHVAALQKAPIPKGVLLCGLPGSGKTTLARYTARLLGRDGTPLPLLKMDITAFKSKYVGETTEKCEHALRTVESAAPAVLLIDEVEKIFGGMGSGNAHEVTSDMFSIILDWMQKKKDKPVFVIATANRSENIPSEFKRKGRFDEVFFVGVPSAEECKEIFAVHLNRRKDLISCMESVTWDKTVAAIAEAVLKRAAELKRFLSGADIESLVDAAFERLFVSEMERLSKYDSEKLKTIEESSVPMQIYSAAQVQNELIARLENTRSYFDNNMQITAGYWVDMFTQQFLEAGGKPESAKDQAAVRESRTILPSEKEAFSAETGRFDLEYLKEKGLLTGRSVSGEYSDGAYLVKIRELSREAMNRADYNGVFRWCLAEEIYNECRKVR